MNKLYNNSKRLDQETKQDLISKDCDLIEENMKGYQLIIDVKIQELSLGSWIKYISIDGKYRTGGVLTVNSYPDYLILKNPSLNKSWSVNLKTNNIYSKLDNNKKEVEREKEVLYKLYKQGLLEIIDN